MKSRRLTSLVSVVAGVVAIAGCAGEPGPIVTETPEPTRSPVVVSASPGAELTTEELLALMPPAADRDDVQGAVVTAHFFIQEFPKLFVTGDFAVWDALSGDECGYCAESRDGAQGYLDDGWVIRRGETVIVEGTTEALPQDDGTILVVFEATDAAVYVTEPGQEERLAGEPRTLRYFMGLEYGGATWQVLGVEIEVV